MMSGIDEWCIVDFPSFVLIGTLNNPIFGVNVAKMMSPQGTSGNIRFGSEEAEKEKDVPFVPKGEGVDEAESVVHKVCAADRE